MQRPLPEVLPTRTLAQGVLQVQNAETRPHSTDDARHEVPGELSIIPGTSRPPAQHVQIVHAQKARAKTAPAPLKSINTPPKITRHGKNRKPSLYFGFADDGDGDGKVDQEC